MIGKEKLLICQNEERSLSQRSLMESRIPTLTSESGFWSQQFQLSPRMALAHFYPNLEDRR